MTRINRIRIGRIQAGLIAGLLGFSFLVSSTHAAETTGVPPESILISPVSKHYDIKAGGETADKLTVINDGKSAFDFVTYARPYSVHDESYVPDFVADTQNSDAYRWIQFEKSSYHVEPGQTVEVNYTMRVPANATPGGHYGVLFAETGASGDVSGGSGVKRKKRVGAILYVTVEGDVTLKGSVKDFTAPFFQLKPPLSVFYRVANTGNTDFTVSSVLKVSDVFGRKKFEAQKDYSVLPNSTRKISLEWQRASWLGLYRVEMTAKFLDTNKKFTQYVLLVPLWMYLLIISLIAGRIGYALLLARRRKR